MHLATICRSLISSQTWQAGPVQFAAASTVQPVQLGCVCEQGVHKAMAPACSWLRAEAWSPPPSDPFVLVEVLSTGENDALVKYQGQEQRVPIAALSAVNDVSNVPDMAMLLNLSEASVLANLLERYRNAAVRTCPTPRTPVLAHLRPPARRARLLSPHSGSSRAPRAASAAWRARARRAPPTLALRARTRVGQAARPSARTCSTRIPLETQSTARPAFARTLPRGRAKTRGAGA